MPRPTAFEFASAPVSEDDLRRVEQTLGVVLPPPYRAFLLAQNGGRPVPSCFAFEGDPDGSLINVFYSVDHADPLRDLVRQAREWWSTVPRDLLPIAIDAGGSVVCLGVDGERTGRVYFWSLEDEPDPPDPTSYENVWLVATSFDEFLETFHEVDVGE